MNITTDFKSFFAFKQHGPKSDKAFFMHYIPANLSEEDLYIYEVHSPTENHPLGYYLICLGKPLHTFTDFWSFGKVWSRFGSVSLQPLSRCSVNRIRRIQKSSNHKKYKGSEFVEKMEIKTNRAVKNMLEPKKNKNQDCF